MSAAAPSASHLRNSDPCGGSVAAATRQSSNPISRARRTSSAFNSVGGFDSIANGFRNSAVIATAGFDREIGGLFVKSLSFFEQLRDRHRQIRRLKKRAIFSTRQAFSQSLEISSEPDDRPQLAQARNIFRAQDDPAARHDDRLFSGGTSAGRCSPSHEIALLPIPQKSARSTARVPPLPFHPYPTAATRAVAQAIGRPTICRFP